MLLCCVVRRSGACTKWLANASAATKRVSATVNGPMLDWLAKEIEYDDPSCVDCSRDGLFVLRFGNSQHS